MGSIFPDKVGLGQNAAEISRENSLLERASGDVDRSRVRELSQEFEAIFLQLMLKSMRDTVPKSELLDGGNGEDVFRSLLDAEYAKSMAQEGFSGIAEVIEQELLRNLDTTHKVVQKAAGSAAYRGVSSETP